jgi:hypothetical protein
MGEARLFPVRTNGGTDTVFMSADELMEAAEQGRLMVAPEDVGRPDEPSPPGPVVCGEELPPLERRFDPTARPIEEIIAEIAGQVPEEEWDRLPPDLSEQHDHYIYGTPKR